jgi:2-keto-4-pentenoate hydratase/2-oxohepta-3-ene-1,7-dioic acid hydratase in catechol pathway
MKFATWVCGTTEEAGILSQDLQSVHSFKSAGLGYASLLDFIINRKEADMKLLQKLAQQEGKPIAGVTLEAPIPRPHHDILCLGLNYSDHAEEVSHAANKPVKAREECVYFSKRVVKAIGPDGVIENHFDIETRLDYEAEVALIIGKDARHVRRSEAWNYVFGICCFNDISARDVQMKHKQWFFGKSLDTFTAFGPYIVTLDEFSLPLALNITSRINGEIRQQSNTSKMIFSPDYCIAELSAGLTLDAGSIIATGTPAGVGFAFNPPKCMKSGDICEIEVEGCGILTNTVA